MNNLKIYSQKDALSYFNPRKGETKLGESILFVDDFEHLENISAKFVILGIPEDIGVKANLGIGGAHTLWRSFLSVFLSVQSNEFIKAGDIALLGEIVPPVVTKQSIEAYRSAVDNLDAIVAPIIEKIVKMGKVPIIIGGGHNNAFPIIKGAATANKKAVNTINIDAHADIRPTNEGRHSGNGFSNALEQGYLNNYYIFGLHQNYNNQFTLDTIKKNERIKAVFFDDLLTDNKKVVENWLIFTKDLSSPCGLELDLDCIANTLSSAATPSGFNINEIRQILLLKDQKYLYFHVCEGAVKLDDDREDQQTAKAVAYLVTDFIKSQKH